MVVKAVEHGAYGTGYMRNRKQSVDKRLWNAIDMTIPQKASVIDIGAGNGALVAKLRKSGRPAVGVDGTPGIVKISNGLVIEVDLALDSATVGFHADWAISIEVGEHIPEEYEDTFIENMCRVPDEGLIVSWAVPGQGGHRHVNCRSPLWVVDKVEKRGLKLHRSKTGAARKKTGSKYSHKLLVFTRE